MDLTFLPLRDFVPENSHAKFGGNWTTNKGETEGGAQFWSYCFLSPSIDPTVLVDLFWFLQKSRLLPGGVRYGSETDPHFQSAFFKIMTDGMSVDVISRKFS